MPDYRVTLQVVVRVWARNPDQAGEFAVHDVAVALARLSSCCPVMDVINVEAV